MADESKQTSPSSQDAQDDSITGEQNNAVQESLVQENNAALESTAPNEPSDTDRPAIDSAGRDAAGDVSPEPADKTPVPEVAVPEVAAPEADSQTTSETQATPRIKIGTQRSGAVAPKARPQTLQQTTDVPEAPVADPSTGSPPTIKKIAKPEPQKFPPPRLPDKLSSDEEQELEAALNGVSMDELISGEAGILVTELADGTKRSGRVLSVRNENVFVELGCPHQGIVSAKQLTAIPEPGATIEVMVQRFDSEEGIYELVVPDAAVRVDDWSELTEGIVVEAVVTGHNKGGLECEVNRIRGFIPASQISPYRVEDFAEFVGEKFSCLVTEAKAERRNLVLSRRAILEREREEAKQKLMEDLAVGQLRDGIVRRLQDFGAFVDLGGVDGLIPISQLSWDRIGHPSEVVEEGQKIKVKINRIDHEAGRISLAYRESWDNPWEKAEQKYLPKAHVQGTVTRLTDFGAFVRMEPGVEGLVHVSELSHKHVRHSRDVLSEGQEVDVVVLSVDAAQQRMSLSIKALQARPSDQPEVPEDASETGDVGPAPKTDRKDLRGGTNRSTGGDNFGLKW